MTALDINLTADFFSLLQVAPVQAIDGNLLDAHYRELQARIHPDRHAHASAADQRLAMQWATRVNEAYQTLKSPLSRARYLLALRGHDVQAESNTAMPVEFLMAQMELREAVAEAKVGADGTALEALVDRIDAEIGAEEGRLVKLLDIEGDNAAAGVLVRQLMFHYKLRTEIEDALDAVLN